MVERSGICGRGSAVNATTAFKRRAWFFGRVVNWELPREK
jgi:hypothetical protein